MRSGGIFDLAQLKDRVAELDELSSSDDLWQDQDRAQEVLRERAGINGRIEILERLTAGLEDVDVFLEMAAEGEEEGLVEAETRLADLESSTSKMEF